MKTITYNKLVRDKIPKIIEDSGKTCEIEVLDDKTYLEMLDKKLTEELNEYYESHNAEELADLLEVVYATAKARGYTKEQLEEIRQNKADKRGAFDRNGRVNYVRLQVAVGQRCGKFIHRAIQRNFRCGESRAALFSISFL